MRVGVLLACLLSVCAPVGAQMRGMDMDMSKPAKLDIVREAYTTNHAFLVKLVSAPKQVPYEKYFTVRLAAYDANNPSEMLHGAHITVLAGMRHGMTSGFAHGMQSTPKVEEENGVTTVSGMYFHMMGAWTLQAKVSAAGRDGVAYFTLPCCAQ